MSGVPPDNNSQTCQMYYNKPTQASQLYLNKNVICLSISSVSLRNISTLCRLAFLPLEAYGIDFGLHLTPLFDTLFTSTQKQRAERMLSERVSAKASITYTIAQSERNSLGFSIQV